MTGATHAKTDGIETATHYQQVASTPSRSAWVSANAGSGKTYVLVNRIIRLMLEGTSPEKILCLTFTKAAAAEMSNRLFERLSKWVAYGDDQLGLEIEKIAGKKPVPQILARARKLFARSLETPGGLKIQTIHGFCESLLQRFPIEAGLSPGFEVLDEAEAKILKQQARNHILARALEQKDSPLGRALSLIVARAEGEIFDQVLDHILRGRETLLQNMDPEESEHPGLMTAQCENLKTHIGLEGAPNRDLMLAEYMRNMRQNRERFRQLVAVLGCGSSNDQKSSLRLETALNTSDDQACFDLLNDFFCTQSGGMRKASAFITKATQDQNADLTDWVFTEQDIFIDIKETLKKIDFYEANTSLYLLADGIDAAYRSLKKSAGKLDYDDLISNSCHLFKRVSGAWVLYKIDGGLEHILVDEAQDTSPAQWQIIKTIAEEFFAGVGASEQERTIFAVGDEKQSIYSFQGADPAQFDKMRVHFENRARQAEKDFLPVPLSVSFRSTGQVLGLVDKIFANAEASNGLTHSGEVDSHIPTRTGQAGRIEVWETIKPEDVAQPDPWDAPLDWVNPQSSSHRLAEKIARKIRKWLDEKEILEPRGRPIEPGDILILVRKRKAFFEAMLRALKSHNIPVAGADRMKLAEQMAVMDLVALGRFMLLPEDDLTLACVLKSPFFDMTEQALFELAYDRDLSLWGRLKSKHEEIYQTLEYWRETARRSTVFDFYSLILGKEGGRKKLTSRLGEEANDPIDEFLSLALEYDQLEGGSLQDFLHRFSKLDNEIKRDMEHGKNEVRLMTIHGAKGLEGNIVFLPETCGVPSRSGASANFTAFEQTGGAASLPVWALSKKDHFSVVSDSLETDKEKAFEEYRRLLYVALTRARDRLYICGFEAKHKRSDKSWYDLVMNGLGEDVTELEEEDGNLIWRLADAQSAEPKDSDAFLDQTGTGASLPDWARQNMPDEEYPPRPLVPSRLDWDELGQPPTSEDQTLSQAVMSPLYHQDSGKRNRFKRGTLIHNLLQYLPEIDMQSRREKAQLFLDKNAGDFSADERREMIEQVSTILEREEFAKLFSPSSKAEVPISALIEPERGRKLAINGQIDRLIVEDGEVLIVDYKTNRPPPQREEDVAPLYMRQMAAYRLILKKIYPDHKVRCVLFWTDAPRLMELSENLLEKALKLEHSP